MKNLFKHLRPSNLVDKKLSSVPFRDASHAVSVVSDGDFVQLSARDRIPIQDDVQLGVIGVCQQ